MYSFVAEKQSLNRSGPEKVVAQLERIKRSALRGSRLRQGWEMINSVQAPRPIKNGNFWKYSFEFRFKRNGRNSSPQILDKQFAALMKNAQKGGNIHKWVCKIGEAVSSVISLPDLIERKKVENLPVKPIRNLDPTGYFDGLIDREAQINVLLSAVKTAEETNFKIRPHSLLFGAPASAKTTMINRLAEMVGEDQVYRIDAPTATQAGVLGDLIERGIQVPYIFIEEAEKVDLKQLRFLLGIMDQRAEIRMCNARMGYLVKAMPSLVIATVNDIDKFDNDVAALSSRFSNRIYCPSITLDIMKKAIRDMTALIHPKDEWIDEAIKYCKQYEPSADLRRIATIVACGRENLMDGSYQNSLRITTR